ncbi:hypothetical protein C8R47DRAFT_1195295 [Mycena vitilis]|nr:hypothetical protein C8R47DRAFT_1195295 [Mycena vitilis]
MTRTRIERVPAWIAWRVAYGLRVRSTATGPPHPVSDPGGVGRIWRELEVNEQKEATLQAAHHFGNSEDTTAARHYQTKTSYPSQAPASRYNGAGAKRARVGEKIGRAGARRASRRKAGEKAQGGRVQGGQAGAKRAGGRKGGMEGGNDAITLLTDHRVADHCGSGAAQYADGIDGGMFHGTGHGISNSQIS